MKLSLEQIKTIVSQAVTQDGLSNKDFNVTRDNVAGLVDKIGKLVYNDSIFNSKLGFMDGDYLSFGKTIEEWQNDLYLPQEFDPSGDGALSYYAPTYRKPFYSYTMKRMTIPVSIRNNDLERACLNSENFVSLTTSIIKRLNDSQETYKYQMKREILGKYIEMIKAASGSDFINSSAYEIGTYITHAGVNYVVVKEIKVSDALTFDTALSGGYIIELKMVTGIARPVDTATGEEFIKQVKTDIEVSEDISEGNSLNGNTLGVSPVGLKLLIKQGIMPSLEVDTLAGAFHTDKLAVPVEIEVVKDFGTAPSNVYAMLIDKRGARLHPSYIATRDQINGKGDFYTLFAQSEWTGYVSRNTFVKVYED